MTLMEADLILVMKSVWARNLAQNIQRSKSLDQAQYAQRGQIPQASVFNKQIRYDLQLILRQDSFQADNDAADCYNRIIDNIVVIASMRMGLSVKGGEFLRDQLRSFKYYIVLGRKPSREDFCNHLLKMIHGTGQGTSWSPIIWSMVCDMIIEVMNNQKPGQYFEMPDRSEATG